MKLRPYQGNAVEAVYNHMRTRDDNPCGVIPTAGGKTPCIAQICRDAVERWGGRVLVLSHVKELLEQSVDHLNRLLQWNQVGVYSAGLNSRDTEHPVIVAGIQSVYQRAMELGRFDVIQIDEAHLIPPDGEGMYQKFLADAKKINQDICLVGWTATPFRMTSGMICAPDNLLNHVCYEVGVKELIQGGYICRPMSKAPEEIVDTSGLHIRGGEFIDSENEALFNRDDVVERATNEIIHYMNDRHACLVFCAGVKHAENVAKILAHKTGEPVRTVFGKTSKGDRQAAVDDFKSGRYRYLVNVGVYTTGFDAPNVDCIAILRATKSPGLFYQMCGRGFRLYDGKENCLVLDYGNNVGEHGPIDSIRVRETGGGKGKGEVGVPPTKTCPECQSIILAAHTVCPDCDYEFPARDPNHEGEASEAGIISGEKTVTKYRVQAVKYSVHTKRGAEDDAPKTMRVEYRVGWHDWEKEWICFEHKGWARKKAESWWLHRAIEPLEPVPGCSLEAVSLADAGCLHVPTSIHVQEVSGEKFSSIVGYDFEEEVEAREAGWDEEDPEDVAAAKASLEVSDDDVPF